LGREARQEEGKGGAKAKTKCKGMAISHPLPFTPSPLHTPSPCARESLKSWGNVSLRVLLPFKFSILPSIVTLFVSLARSFRSHQLQVNPAQMKLLRKMSATGLRPEDVGPYSRRKLTIDTQTIPAVQPIWYTAAFVAPLMWAPWGSFLYCACLPLLVATAWLVSLMPQEIARYNDMVEQEDSFANNGSVSGSR
jgi:hypothetical protein